MIVIPMAGLSRRFKESGYALPKYMLEADSKSLFAHSVASFEHYFNQEKFLFIALDVFGTKKFIETECVKLAIQHYQIIILDQPTRGQAETVYLGLKNAKIDPEEDLLIFNIDTFRYGFRWPLEFDLKCIDGYLETFIGEGKNWSNVLPTDKTLQTVKHTAEKQEISKYCCTGLYYWQRSEDFCKIFEDYQNRDVDQVQGGEYYIAPMYNSLIDDGKDVRYSVISKEEVTFCGIPREYISFLKEIENE